jgi:hypothetical protein
MPSPFAGFHVDVPRSPVVQLVKLLTPIRAFNSQTPFSVRPVLIASRTYRVWRILIGRDEIVAEMHFIGTAQ